MNKRTKKMLSSLVSVMLVVSAVTANGTVALAGDSSKTEIHEENVLNTTESEAVDTQSHEHEYIVGKCECGDILEAYKWYYNSSNKTEYEIGSAEQLSAFSQIVNSGVDSFYGKTIKLTSDIDLSSIEMWSSIGGWVYSFRGIFDGQNHVISNMKIDWSGVSEGLLYTYEGLFGHIDNGGVLKNFTLYGEMNSGDCSGRYVGGVCGRVSKGASILNVTSHINITAPKAFVVGGIAGGIGETGAIQGAVYSKNAKVENCVNYGNVLGCNEGIGGVVGYSEGEITGCANFGTVVNGDDNPYTGFNIYGTGGIVGISKNLSVLENCYNVGNIVYNNKNAVGGIIGYQSKNSTTRNCYNVAKLDIFDNNGTAYDNCNSGIGLNEGIAENIYALSDTKGVNENDPVSNGYQGTSTNCGYKEADEMKSDTFVELLGDAFTKDTENINNGYPILKGLKKQGNIVEDNQKNGWVQDNDSWFYYENGKMVTGWKQIGSAYYYLYEDGHMASDEWIGDYYVNADGVWQQNLVPAKWMISDGKWWYRNEDGTYPSNCWKMIEGKWYHFDASGYMETGWLQLGNEWYYLGESGNMQTGWILIRNCYYYMNAAGVMQTGWLRLDGCWYYLNASGAMQTGWIYVNRTWYYGDPETGALLEEEWLEDTYYFHAGGSMAVGWALIDEVYYYFNVSGVKQTSTWVENYYVKEDGTMATDEWVDNDRYYVDSDGVWMPNKTK